MAFGRFGLEFLISSLTGLDQQDVALAAAANGTFGAVFEHEIVVGQGTLEVAHSQLFNADGSRIGATLRVPGSFAGSAIDPDISAMSDGRFVTLQNYIQNSQQPIFESLINTDGTLVGNGVLAGFSSQTIAGNPALATRSDGLMVEVHQTRNVADTNSNIFATLINATGAQVGQLSDVTPVSNSDQHNPDVAALTDGRFVTVYQTDDTLKARFLSVTLGQAFPLASSGAEIAVAGGANVDFRPVVTQIAGGGFMLAFYSTNGTVSGRIYNSSGVLQGATFVIANLSADGAVVGDRDIAITTLTDGSVVVAWTGTQGTAGLQSPETATSGTYVDFKVFNPTFLPGQAGFLVTQASLDPRLDGATTVFAGNQFDPALTALADGRFVLAFTDQSGGSQSGSDDASGLALRGQIFDLRTAGITLGGTAGNDQYFGSDFTDVISGFDGDDDLNGGAGGDTLIGGTNTAAGDTLGYVFSSAGVSINLATNSAAGGAAQGDIISGFENVTGSGFADQLVGDNGSNVLIGGAGGDTLNGGSNGSVGDTLSYVSSIIGVSINLALNTASGGDATGDTISNFENVTGTAQGDQLVGDGNANVLRGGAGNDLFVGGLGADTMIGGADLDVVDYSSFATGVAVDLTLGTGTGGDIISEIENITGSAFGDVLIGDNGANTMRGGVGNDFFVAGNGADLLNGGADNDEVSYETATTGVFVNLFTGTGANGGVLQEIENIRGSAFGDVLQGDNGANTIRGLAGNDFIIAGNGADFLIGGADNDTVSYETATSGVFANLATGVGANGGVLQEIENLTGSAFGDVLIGSAGGNTLKGGAGNDFIVGNAGSDALFGGADNDTFRFETTTFGNDVIADFQDNADKLSFASAVATNFNQFTILNNTTTNVTVQIAGQSIVVQGLANISLTASDFLFV